MDLPDFQIISKHDTEWELEDLDLIQTQQLVFSDNNNRFSNPVSTTEFEKRISDRIPAKTKSSTNWSVNVWQTWAENRNCNPITATEHYTCVPVEIQSADLPQIDFWMSRFIMECRREDGSPYPPNTLMNLTNGLQRYLRENGRPEIFFLPKNTSTFSTFQKALDARMKELTHDGIGIHKKRADPVSIDDEKILWEKGIFSMTTSEGLSFAVFYYNCKLFGFRGMDEHRDLDVSQYKILIDYTQNKRCLKFFGRVSKNVQGGINHRKIEPKQITHWEDTSNPRDIVKLFSTYLKYVPSEGPFYRRPIGKMSLKNEGTKFSAQVIGVNKLSTYIKLMFDKAGIDCSNRNISNHSGKVSCVTTLYNSGFDDSAVKSRSGHRSNAVETYKRQSTEMSRNISNALQPPRPTVSDDKENIPTISNVSCSRPTDQKVQSNNDENELIIHVPKSVKRLKVVSFDGKVMSFDM
ncbi:uncharacterized protein LOC134722460 [Mytilus trossulus]|uniref:uncharacterized protein LOC134722460 n=1 Tax=Mytilus trossulus TaxID=6551 RepID=UPI00300405C8